MYKAIYAPAWDLVDDGWNAALERIRETAFYDDGHIRRAGPAPIKAALDALESA